MGANLSQLAIKGNFRDVDSRDMGGIYSRNVGRQQLVVSNFAHSSFKGNTDDGAVAKGPPTFSETNVLRDCDVFLRVG